jgi:hypothetical protein
VYFRSLAAAAATALLGVTPEAQGIVQHVVHVSVDGLRGDLLRNLLESDAAGRFPNFARLVSEGASTFAAQADFGQTNTLPNHTTMVSGRPIKQPALQAGTVHHGYTFNVKPQPGETIHNLGNPNVPYVHSTFDVVHDHGLSTALYASKSKFLIFEQSYDAVAGAPDVTGADDGPDKIDSFFAQSTLIGAWKTSDDMQAAFLADMAANDYAYVLVHYRNPDSAGHLDGWGSPSWEASIEEVDDYLGELLSLVESDPGLAGTTAVIVTSDHGGSSVSHSTAGYLSHHVIPFFVWGPGVDAGRDLYALNPGNRLDPDGGIPDYDATPQPIRNGESGNLALQLLGLPPVPGSTLGVLQDLALGVGGRTLLSGDETSLDLTLGGMQGLLLDAPATPFSLYVVLGSASGTTPGFSFGGFTVPLEFDRYFLSTLELSMPYLGGQVGLLGPTGSAAASFWMPAASDPVLAGLQLNHAYAVVDFTAPAPVLAVSNAAPVTLALPGQPTLVINEIDYDQPGSDVAEFIEIHNFGSTAADLTRVTLDLVDSSGNNLAGYDLGLAGDLLPAGAYLVVAQTAVIQNLPTGVLTVTLPIGNDDIPNTAPLGLQLYDSGYGVLDSVTFDGKIVGLTEGPQGADGDSDSSDVSIARIPDGQDTDDNRGDFATTSTITPGVANVP